jgi:hypothetical protein
METAQEHEVVEDRGSAVAPEHDVVGVVVTRGGASREPARAVARLERPAQAGRDDTRLASGHRRHAVSFDHLDERGVTRDAAGGLGGDLGSGFDLAQPRFQDVCLGVPRDLVVGDAERLFDHRSGVGGEAALDDVVAVLVEKRRQEAPAVAVGVSSCADSVTFLYARAIASSSGVGAWRA